MTSLEEDGFDLIWTPAKIDSIYRLLVFRCKFTPAEAGNLIGILMGIEFSETGWQPKQLKQLLFLKYLEDVKNVEFVFNVPTSITSL